LAELTRRHLGLGAATGPPPAAADKVK
jgi:hypothetical protein